MLNAQDIIHESDFKQILKVCEGLAADAHAKLVFIVDKNGQLIVSSGETGSLDTTSLATLAAGNIAATSGLAKLLGEQEFTILFHEGAKDNLHLSIIAERYILVVVFDGRTSLGLVRLWVKKASQQLEETFVELAKRNAESGHNPLFAEITDEDIDNLFDD
jgi:predicted regulator of Ras-like GTPase activity (Roadblock/LC7/MglB family)